MPARGVGAAPGSHLDLVLIDVAPRPILTWFERRDDRVPGRVKMPRGVLVRGRIAATDMAAGTTEPQGHPPAAALQALFPLFRCPGLHVADFLHVFTRHRPLPWPVYQPCAIRRTIGSAPDCHRNS